MGERDAVSVAVSYIGHATLLIELGGRRVLTDPMLRRGVFHVRRRVAAPRVEDLVPLDAIVISHAHHDHLDTPSLRLVAAECPVIAPRGCEAIVRRGRPRSVIGVDAGDRVAVGGISVEAIPALHDGRRYPFGPQLAALGFLVEGPPSVYFAGDTDLFPQMRQLAGRVDVAALPVGGWGPRIPPGHLDPERAARAAALIEPRVVIPIHWGTLVPMGARPGVDPWAPPRAFESAVARLAPEVEVHVLAPGERLVLDGLCQSR
jgi:L-ascorbate metabolism protein UlaG (beta-lactamase superfamily)